MADIKDMELVYNPIIKVETDGSIKIRGETLSPEDYGAFTTSMRGFKDSHARKLIRDELKWRAINQGIHNCTSNEQLVFAKAALWLIAQEEELISSF